MAKKKRSRLRFRSRGRRDVRPSVDKLIDKLVAESILRRPLNVEGGMGDLAAKRSEVLHVEVSDSGTLLRAKDLKYEMFDNKGQRINSDGIAQWYQVVSISDADT